jgi:hypothetical protein
MKRELIKIESKIKGVLQPVMPRADFILELRALLDQEMIRKQKAKKVQTGLLVAGGIVSLAVMVISIIRSIASLGEIVKGISKSMPRSRKREQTASA